MNSVLKTLKNARRLLSIHWIQGAAMMDDDGFCLSMAVTRSANTLGDLEAARNRLYDVIPTGCSIVEFNDTPGRTQAEILEVVNKAITNASTR